MKRLILAAAAASLATPIFADPVEQAKAAADVRAEMCIAKIAKGTPIYGKTGFCLERVVEDVPLRDRSGEYIEPDTQNSMRFATVGNGVYTIKEQFNGRAWESVMVPWQTTATTEIKAIHPEAVGLYAVVETENNNAISFWIITADGRFFNLTEGMGITPSP